MKFGLEEVLEIVKPHNDRIIAEVRAERLQTALEKGRATRRGRGPPARYA